MMMKLFLVLGILVCCSPLARAYRDLETGTFLTRDPIGYGDGPNVYCYVHCNPITHFDAWGLDSVALYDGSDPGASLFSDGLWLSLTEANGTDYNNAASFSDHQIDMSSSESVPNALQALVDSGVEIDTVNIYDGGAPGIQEAGETVLSETGDKGVTVSIGDIGSRMSEGGTINLYGCNFGQDTKTLQTFANAANQTVTAGTGLTKYKSVIAFFFGLGAPAERTGETVSASPKEASTTDDSTLPATESSDTTDVPSQTESDTSSTVEED